MIERKSETNWENFLDILFNFYDPKVEKKEYRNGLTINYSKGGIYVWCDIDKTKLKIKKLEFGRLLNEGEKNEQPNWIKGVFSNDEKGSIEFLQTSFDGEKRDELEFDRDGLNKNLVYRFLQIPCETGWTEEEYFLDKDKYYKVIVHLKNLSWTIILKNIAEQDMPMPTDRIDIWLRVKIFEAFWNKHRLHINKIQVAPMNQDRRVAF